MRRDIFSDEHELFRAEFRRFADVYGLRPQADADNRIGLFLC